MDIVNRETTLELMLDFGPDGKNLIPVVTQDVISKDVLLVAYTNKKAFEMTQMTGYATYWSRSRNQLWTKGNTSGDLLRVADMRINCEQNSLLYLVFMQGAGSCHTSYPEGNIRHSCYYRRIIGNHLKYI